MALVAFDNTILSVLLFPDADLRQGTDAAPVDRARERVDGLVQELAAAGEQVLIPTPALAEVLATPGCDMDEVLSALRVSAYIRIGISICVQPLNSQFGYETPPRRVTFAMA